MKKQLIFFCFLILIIGFSNCKSDKPSDASVEDIAEDYIAQQLAEAEAEAAMTEGAVGNEVEVDMKSVTVDQAKVIEQKKEILKEQLKESPNLGKDCESILEEYGKLVDQFVKGTDKDEVMKKLIEWANDPIFNKCKKNPEYKEKFYILESKMYPDDEEL